MQIFFGLIWCRNGVRRQPRAEQRPGPVDFKVSYSAGDKSLIEFKLAGNSSLKRNLENQVDVYKKAHKTEKALKVIVCYTVADQTRVERVLKELELDR